jgi:endonuclease/exonuclease/phosphatase family metal-dependent hydrolase
LLAGDFNLIRCATDKNSGHVSARLCDAFNDTIESLGIVEVPLLDKLFTWSNHRENHTLELLDRVFINNSQCQAFPATTPTSLVRPTSDHTPILATRDVSWHYNGHWVDPKN